MRHACTECRVEIADGARTEWCNAGKWTLCGAGLYNTQPDTHGGEPSIPHRHVTCPVQERWYVIQNNGFVGHVWTKRPNVLPGERIIRVSEEYAAAYVKIKQLWPEE